MTFTGPDKKKNLLFSMGILAAIVVGAGFGTMAITGYFRSQDPIYQCIDNPTSQPYQASIPVSVNEDGIPVLIPKGVGIENNCIRPIHTVEENTIHIAYSREYKFTLGHFLYYWIGKDIQKYNTLVFVNGAPYTGGSFLDIPLKQGDSIRIEFTSR